MAISPYMAGLRRHIGHDLLMMPSVSAVVVNPDGEILLGQRADNGRWALIAGTVDPGEQPAAALVREVYEETGVRVAVDRLAGVALHPTNYPNGDSCQYLNVWFRCHPVEGTARVNDDESLAVGWFRLDRLPEIHPFTRLRIDTALSDDAPAWFAGPGEVHVGLTTSDVS